MTTSMLKKAFSVLFSRLRPSLPRGSAIYQALTCSINARDVLSRLSVLFNTLIDHQLSLHPWSKSKAISGAADGDESRGGRVVGHGASRHGLRSSSRPSDRHCASASGRALHQHVYAVCDLVSYV